MVNRYYQGFYNSKQWFLIVDVYEHYLITAENGYGSVPIHIYISSGLLIIVSIFVIFINPFQYLYKRTRIFGSARFAEVRDIIKVGLLGRKGKEFKEGTFICDAKVGLFKKKRLLLNQPLSVLLLAPPGTGKTAGVAIPTLFLAKNTIIALDVKGELFDITSKYRNKFSDVMVFDPTSWETSRWNPLDKTVMSEEWAAKQVHVQNIAATIFLEPENDKHWIMAARTIFINVALALIHKNGGTTIPEVRRATLAKEGMERNLVIASYAEYEGLPVDVEGELRKFETVAENQFAGEIGTFDTNMVAFTDLRVENALSKNEIRFDELRGVKGKGKESRSKTLYLIIKPEDIDRLAPLVRIFFETLTKYLLSKKWNKETEHIITFLLDEFPRLGKMKEIVKMPALSRGQGANAYLIAQDASQIEVEYKKEGREEIMSTTAYKVVLSQNSKETAEFVSKTIGDKTMEIRSKSINADKISGGNQSFREQGVPLIRPQEIESMKMWNCLVLGQFSLQTPIKGQLLRWFKDPLLKKRAGKIAEGDIYRPKAEDEEFGSAEFESFLDDYENETKESFREKIETKKESESIIEEMNQLEDTENNENSEVLINKNMEESENEEELDNEQEETESEMYDFDIEEEMKSVKEEEYADEPDYY